MLGSTRTRSASSSCPEGSAKAYSRSAAFSHWIGCWSGGRGAQRDGEGVESDAESVR